MILLYLYRYRTARQSFMEYILKQGCIKFRIPPPPSPPPPDLKKNWKAFQKGRRKGKKKREKERKRGERRGKRTKT